VHGAGSAPSGAFTRPFVFLRCVLRFLMHADERQRRERIVRCLVRAVNFVICQMRQHAFVFLRLGAVT